MSSTLSTITSSTSSCTDVVTEHCTHKWVIKKFKFLPQEKRECISSPIFRTANNESEWKLNLFPHGEKEEFDGYVSLFLYLNSLKPGTRKIAVHAQLSIPQVETVYSFVYTFEGSEGRGRGKMVKRSELLKSCATDDTVTILCTIDIPQETITESVDTTESNEQAFDFQGGQLSHAFRALYRESKFSDVVVIVETQRFSAHKLVLAARSPVFSAMFENKETRENLTNEVRIEDMEPAVVEAMLEFFYTDEVTNLEEVAYGLLEAANKYDVERLRSMCEKVLFKSLNKENAAEVLVHADLHHSYLLKEHVMKFIADNYLDVIQSDSYTEIKDPELLKELMNAIASRYESKK